MPAGTSAPASSDVLGLLNTKPANTPPTMGGGNWLTVGSWNKPPTGQSLTNWNSWLGKIGVPQNTFGQFLINPVTGQYSLPANQNLQGGIGSKPAYQTFPLYNQPTTPTTTTPTTTTPPPSIYTPDMPNYVGGEYNPVTTGNTTGLPSRLTSNTPEGWRQYLQGNFYSPLPDTTGWNTSQFKDYWQNKFGGKEFISDIANPTTTTPTTTTPTTTTPKTTTPTTFSNPNQQAWLNYATRAGYNPSRLMSYYNRRNQRIQ